MKTRLLTLFILLSLTFGAKAQYVTIPDTGFVQWLNLNGYSTCLNGNQMDTTCSAVVRASRIRIQTGSMTDLNGIQYFDSIKTLECFNNAINNIPAFPALLTSINIQSGRLVSLPPLPANLLTLACNGNALTSLPALPNGMNQLMCANNQISVLPPIPASMKQITFTGNRVSVYPVVPDSLVGLYMGYNYIDSIPTLPSQLKELEISGYPVTTLAPFPSGLYRFNAARSFTNIFPALPSTLTELDCSGNSLSSLPSLPAGLQILKCGNNPIGSLPALPINLNSLNCSTNNLSSLPVLPASLVSLTCNGNNLTSIPPLRDSLYTLWCYDNPNLTCLPELGVVNSLYFYNTAISCLPNYPVVISSSPLLNTLPLCTPFNSNGCAVYANLSGLAFIDTIQNCTYNTNERTQPNLKTSLYNNGVLQEQILTGSEGLYSFDAGYGNYEIRIDTTNTPFTVTCPSGISRFDTLSASDSTTQNLNFALRCKGGFDLAAHSISSPMRFIPGRLTYVNIQAGDLANFFNGNCAYGVNGVVTAIIDGPARYISPLGTSLAPSSVNGDTLKWNIADFAAISGQTDFYVIVETDTFATAGTNVCLTLNVTPHADNDSTNNVTTTCYTVVSSFDPNDKQVSPPGDIDTLQKWLTYTVRFQNTGTAEAQHIYIMDTLDTNIDGSSFQLLAYSHQPQVLINENIVRFNFANINLPDSNTNEPESHGYIQYKVKLKNNLPVGTTINNTAFIYFDFNAPVVTNTTTSTISVKQDTTTVGIRAIASPIEFTLYPNPTQQQFTVTTTLPNQTLQIFDIEGRIVYTQNIIGTATTINISNMASGVYVVGLSNTNVRKRLVKL